MGDKDDLVSFANVHYVLDDMDAIHSGTKIGIFLFPKPRIVLGQLPDFSIEPFGVVVRQGAAA